jgi:hypothetical protein
MANKESSNSGASLPDSKALQAAIKELQDSLTNATFRIAILMQEATRDASRRKASLEMAKRMKDLGLTLGFTPQDTDESTIELLEDEKRKGFPQHYGMTAIGIWSALDAYLDDILAQCLMHNPPFLKTTSVAALNGPLLPFSKLPSRDQYRHLGERLLTETSGERGVERYEATLKKLGLGGAVNSAFIRLLKELNAVRNLFAHRRGIADRKFLEQCPQLNAASGEEFLINEDLVVEYVLAVLGYGTTVAKRVLDRLGLPDRGIDSQAESFYTTLQEHKKHRNPARKLRKTAKQGKA